MGVLCGTGTFDELLAALRALKELGAIGALVWVLWMNARKDREHAQALLRLSTLRLKQQNGSDEGA